jgi:hypothetical protein
MSTQSVSGLIKDASGAIPIASESSIFLYAPSPFITPQYLFFISKNPEMNQLTILPYSLYKQGRKEDLFLTAIRNLRKKINFISLNNEYQNGDISEDEFEKELEVNQHKYVVNVSALKDKIDLEILQEIIPKIDDDITIDEAAEVFSIDIQSSIINKQN